MKLVVQRVSRAAVRVEGRVVGEIGAGMLVLLGVEVGDGPGQAEQLAERLARWRFFADAEGRMNRSALEVGAACLVVSQFTLAVDGSRPGGGRRPSFERAAPAEVAAPLCERFAARLEALGLSVARGRFGARMEVELVNEGPVTFVLEQGCDPK